MTLQVKPKRRNPISSLSPASGTGCSIIDWRPHMFVDQIEVVRSVSHSGDA